MLNEPILIKKKRHSKSIFIIALIFTISLIGIGYAFFSYVYTGERNEIVTGQIYMKLVENNEILLKDAIPQSKEDGLKRTDNSFSFQINAKNTSDEVIYYGISLVEGNEQEGTRIKPEHIMIYLECDGEVLIDGIRYNDWNNQRIWVDTIPANTNTEKIKNYTLRMWIDGNVHISDTNPDADYTTEIWNNSYASLKVKVNGNLDTMNMPLSIETGDTMVENNKAYFITKISNFTDMTTYGLRANDQVDLVIEGTNKDIEFSYKDSLGNVVTEPTESLNLSYPFNKNTNIEVQVFVTPKNDANGDTDISITLNKNGERIQSLTKHMNVYGNNFCLNNGFNKLYDCILASDSLASNVTAAISNIEAKGEPNLNDTAPSYTYVEEITLDVENVFNATGYKFNFSNSYKINSTTGTFDLYNSDGSDIITDYLSETYLNYYTCGSTNHGHIGCNTIFLIKATNVSDTTYTITKGDKITSKVSSTIRSEVGLYKTEDDYGDSYIFRGDVKNNNVLFGGYYWKIVRTNGDNSIRLIYNGTSPNATGKYTLINTAYYTYSAKHPLDSSPIGPRVADPTYVGYMYGRNFERQTSEETNHTNIVALTKYYFADDYEFDATNEVFKLKKKEIEPISKTFSEMNTTDETTGKKLYELYPYTCKSTSLTDSCEVILQVKSVTNEKTARVQYHSYSSKDKESTRTNEMSSNVKTQLENWYGTNIVGKTDGNGNLITDYIVDGTFCNNRGIDASTYNSGYLLSKNTHYMAYTNLYSATDKKATLKCSDIGDKFSATSSKGNGLLTYPVALITADEVALAGGKTSAKNENFYLRTNGYYWTMTPGRFDSDYALARMMYVYPTGALYPTGGVNATSYGVRSVINLHSNVLISQGDGTMENPFVLKLA